MNNSKNYWWVGAKYGMAINFAWTILTTALLRNSDPYGILTAFLNIHNGPVFIAMFNVTEFLSPGFYKVRGFFPDYVLPAVYVLVTGFIIGAIIGWIYGKFKKHE